MISQQVSRLKHGESVLQLVDGGAGILKGDIVNGYAVEHVVIDEVVVEGDEIDGDVAMVGDTSRDDEDVENPDSPVYAVITIRETPWPPTRCVFHWRRLDLDETPQQEEKQHKACLEARRNLRKQSLIKTVADMQQGHEHPHSCNQRVLLVVQKIDNGEFWTTGSQEWVGRLKANLPITNYVGTGDEDDKELINSNTFGIPQAVLPTLRRVPPQPAAAAWLRSQQLAAISMSIIQQGPSPDVGENDMF